MRVVCNAGYKTAGFWTIRMACWLCSGVAQQTAGRSQDTSIIEAVPAQLSLAQAQQIAARRNWDLLAAAAGVDLAIAQKVVAREFPNPTLALSTAKIDVDSHPGSTPAGNGLWERSYDTIIALNQLFEIGGKRANRRASAEAGYETARAQFLDARRILELAVTKAYIAATQADENVRVLTESAATLRQEVGLADIRLRAGEISSADKSQIEITADRFELDARAARSAAAQARVALGVLMGTPRATGDIVLSDDLDVLCAATNLPDLNRFPERRPDIVAADAALRKAEADVRLQRSNRIPDPTVFAQYEHEPPDQPNTIGLGVSLPLPLWNRNRGNIAAAEASRQQARVAFDKIRGQAAGEVATAQLAYEDASQRWRQYREVIRPKSETIRKTISYAFEKGGSSLLDLLISERNDNEIRLAAAQAASDLATALATLRVATKEISNLQESK
jgi:cobalt-zinc-cadmium efflux system outer membrane protein